MMTDAQVRGALGESEVTWLTLWGEGRGEPAEGQIFILSVIRTRVQTPERWPDTYAGVCLQKAQFSCWSPAGGTSNYDAVMTLARGLVGDYHDRPTLTPLMRQLRYFAEGIIGGEVLDNAHAANHYCTRALWKSARPPSWTIGQMPVAQVGAHVGFRL